jgi:hypothetical protein
VKPQDEPAEVCQGCGRTKAEHELPHIRMRHVYIPVTPDEFRQFWREMGYPKDLPKDKL